MAVQVPRRGQRRVVWVEITEPLMLRAYMNRRGMTAAQLARRCECSAHMIWHLLAGRRKSCSPGLAMAIAETLDMPMDLFCRPKMTSSAA